MLEKTLFVLSLMVGSTLAQGLCEKDASDGYQVRLSLNTALGDKAYEWTPNEMFLFRATLAFAMRNYFNSEAFNVDSILVCNQTPRVSFWFVVLSPGSDTTLVKKKDVEKAVRLSRNRINSAFMLSDSTMEFVGINPTFAPPVNPSTPPWLIVFGVVMGLVCTGIIALLVTSLVQKKRKTNEKAEDDDEEESDQSQIKGMENGVACENMDGIYNRSFSDDDRFTKM